MQGDFDDILGQDDPEKEHKEWVEENKTESPSHKSFRVLNDAYQKSQKRWAEEEELKEEFDYRYEKAKAKLNEQKEEFEKGYR